MRENLFDSRFMNLYSSLDSGGKWATREATGALWVQSAQIDAYDLVRTSPLSHSRTSPRAERREAERSGVERSEAERNGAQRSGALRSERASE